VSRCNKVRWCAAAHCRRASRRQGQAAWRQSVFRLWPAADAERQSRELRVGHGGRLVSQLQAPVHARRPLAVLNLNEKARVKNPLLLLSKKKPTPTWRNVMLVKMNRFRLMHGMNMMDAPRRRGWTSASSA
jgi:hypothetical protein